MSHTPEYHREWRTRNLDSGRNATRKWRAKNPEKKLWMMARIRARKADIPFDIEPEDIHIPEVCPVLGFQLVVGGDSRTCPSLDRIKPELGYVKGNIQVISYKANVMKSNATFEELRKFAEWVTNAIRT
jgi:hypothetical protein